MPLARDKVESYFSYMLSSPCVWSPSCHNKCLCFFYTALLVWEPLFIVQSLLLCVLKICFSDHFAVRSRTLILVQYLACVQNLACVQYLTGRPGLIPYCVRIQSYAGAETNMCANAVCCKAHASWTFTHLVNFHKCSGQ
jgi:hypothetical protein